MGYKQKLGSKEKNTPTNFNEKDAKRVSESFKFAPSDMEVTITASQQTVKRGGSKPTPGSANVDKVIEMKKKRTFKSDEALTRKEKEQGKNAASNVYSKQKVTFKNRK